MDNSKKDSTESAPANAISMEELLKAHKAMQETWYQKREQRLSPRSSADEIVDQNEAAAST